MKNSLLFSFILVILSAGTAWLNNDPQVIKQNQSIRLLSNGDVELLVKRYYNEAKNTHVTFIATVHFGEKSFYDQINNMIANKVLIYELHGMPWETKKFYVDALHKLDSSHQEKNRLVQLLTNTNLLLAKTFGLSAEANEKNLDRAFYRLHADTNDQNETIMKMATNENAFKKYIDDLAEKIFESDDGKLLGNLSRDWVHDVKRNNPSQTLDEYLQGQGTTLIAALETMLSMKTKDLQETGLNKVFDDLLNARQSPLAYQDYVRFQRNKAVNPFLQHQIYSLTQWPNGYDVTILYGVLHFQDIDAMLKEYGFMPVLESGGEKWVKLLNIPKAP